MNSKNVRRAFVAFHFTLGAAVFIQSVLAVFHAVHSPIEGHLGILLPWFAGLEALAAVLFLIPGTLRIGGWILLAIFVVAIVIHGPVSEIPLFVYAAGIIFVLIHGSGSGQASDPTE